MARVESKKHGFVSVGYPSRAVPVCRDGLRTYLYLGLQALHYSSTRAYHTVLWGFVWANVKLNLFLFPFVFYLLSIGAWVT